MKRIKDQTIGNQRPTHLGTVNGVRYFEHPRYGDESPLLANLDGVWYITDFWEVPDLSDVCELMVMGERA